MVMDFGFLKEVMIKEIHEPCDHGLILWFQDYDVIDRLYLLDHVSPAQNRTAREGQLTQSLKIPRWLKLYQLDSVPTAENLARHWFQRLDQGIAVWCSDHNVTLTDTELLKVRVYETPNCWAEYPS